MSENTPDPVDMERLREASMGDRDFEQILLAAFVEEAEIQCREIAEAVRNGSQEALTSAAHSLKGSSANVGAEEVRRICAVLERLDPQADTDGARILAADLEMEFRRVLDFMKHMQA